MILKESSYYSLPLYPLYTNFCVVLIFLCLCNTRPLICVEFPFFNLCIHGELVACSYTDFVLCICQIKFCKRGILLHDKSRHLKILNLSIAMVSISTMKIDSLISFVSFICFIPVFIRSFLLFAQVIINKLGISKLGD